MKRYAGQYERRQYVGIDLHRRRRVVVRTTDAGELLEAVQITNSQLALAEVMTRAGEHPRPCSKPPTAGTGRATRWPSDALTVQGPGPRGPGQVRRGSAMSDLFGVAGTDLLDRLELPAAYAARIASLRRIMDLLDFEIDVFANLTMGRLPRDPGCTAVQTIPGIGPDPRRCSWPRSATSTSSAPRRS